MHNFIHVLEHAIQTRASMVIHGGDMFDHAGVPEAVVDQAYFHLSTVADAGIPVCIIAGNHERSSLPPSLLLRHERIHVFHSAGRHVVQTDQARVEILGVPFVRGDVVNLALRADHENGRRSADLRFMLMHQPVEGATVGPVGYTFRNRPDVIPLSALPSGYDGFLSGHIHRQQILRNADGVPIIYPGSIERTSTAERFEEKGFFELVFADGKRSVRRIGLQARPHHEINLQAGTPLELCEQMEGAVLGFPADAIIRLKGERGALQRVTSRMVDACIPMSMSVSYPWAQLAPRASLLSTEGQRTRQESGAGDHQRPPL